MIESKLKAKNANSGQLFRPGCRLVSRLFLGFPAVGAQRRKERHDPLRQPPKIPRSTCVRGRPGWVSSAWPRSNERNLRKTRKLLQRKGCHFYCSKFVTLPVSCWFTNFFGTLLKKFWIFENEQIWTCWRHLSKQFCPGAEHLKVKKRVYLREMGIHLHSTANIYILAQVSTSRWMKSREIKQKTARDVWLRWTRQQRVCRTE